MDRVYLVFSDSQQSNLPSITEEDKQVNEILSRRDVKGHFKVSREKAPSISIISKYLITYQDDLQVFLYSGHAGEDQLLLNDEKANAEGIQHLLARCPKLKLVVLNGCSTKGQVEALLDAGVPVVIATSAPVGDQSAAQFSISFFQSLADRQSSIEEAFDDAIGAAKTQHEGSLKVMIENRGALKLDPELSEDAPLWGLYYEHKADLEWTLSLGSPDNSTAYQPNEILLEKLINSLAGYDKDSNAILELMETGVNPDKGSMKNAILKCLPHPISEQLRKLIAEDVGFEGYTFYNKPSLSRLRQISHTFYTMIELLSFILLADLWRTMEKNEDHEIAPEDLQVIYNFFSKPPTIEDPFQFVPFIRSIRVIMQKHQWEFFMNEFPNVSEAFNRNTEYAAACRFLGDLPSKIHKRLKDREEEAKALCQLAEEHLATFFSELGFLAHYSLTSVRNINVLKFRYPPDPKFNHQVIKFTQQIGGLARSQEILNIYMDADSVLLQKKNGEAIDYLNLSPFIIDECAFEDKAILTKLYFFERFNTDRKTQRYRNVYKPDDQPLIVEKQKYSKVLQNQFNAFAESLFNKPLDSL